MLAGVAWMAHPNPMAKPVGIVLGIFMASRLTMPGFQLRVHMLWYSARFDMFFGDVIPEFRDRITGGEN